MASLEKGLGERLKRARQAADLSLRQVAGAAGVSAQAISKYERGLDVPSSGVLLRLARALGTNLDVLVRPRVTPELTPVEYRKHKALPAREEATIHAKARNWLDRYLEIEELVMPEREPFSWPKGFPRMVASGEDVERAADDLRAAWEIGKDPIHNLTELLEDRGIKVGVIDADDRFDACSFYAGREKKAPFVVIRRGMPGDRQRFTLAHELGHLLLEFTAELDADKAEKLVYRFAAAFIVPREAARAELGDRRHRLDLVELALLKREYGLSMAAWVHRAEELGILPEAAARSVFEMFDKTGWRLREPGEPYPSQDPRRFERLVRHALAEEVISEARAAELLIAHEGGDTTAAEIQSRCPSAAVGR